MHILLWLMAVRVRNNVFKPLAHYRHHRRHASCSRSQLVRAQLYTTLGVRPTVEGVRAGLWVLTRFLTPPGCEARARAEQIPAGVTSCGLGGSYG